MAGIKIVQQMFWVPQTGSIGTGASILSYNQQVHFGLIADARIMERPADITARFNAQFEALARRAGRKRRARP